MSPTGEGWIAKVADFGIAKVLSPDATETQAALGTPAYMAPEQALGRAVDARTDVYAIGLILYEQLCQRRAFEGETLAEITRRVLEEEPPPPRRLRPATPRDLQTICLKAIAKAPDSRYATAADLADDLQAWSEGRPIKARPRSWAEWAWMTVRRQPAVILGLLLVAALLLAFLPGGRSRGPAAADSEVAQSRLRIERWQVNLYKPPRAINYTDLEEEASRLAHLLERGSSLSRDGRREAHAARAEAMRLMGRSRAALEALDRALEQGGRQIGELYFQRALLNWEELVRCAVTERADRAQELLQQIQQDLRRGLDSGFQNEWQRDFARAAYRLTETREEGKPQWMPQFVALSQQTEKRTEEVDKFLGDVHVLLKDPAQAIRHYQRAIAACECYVQAYNGLAVACVMQGDEDYQNVQAAFKAAFRAITINPRNEESYFLFGRLCRNALHGGPEGLTRTNAQVFALVSEAVARLRAGAAQREDSYAIQMAFGSAAVLHAFQATARKKDPEPALREALSALQRAAQIRPRAAEPWLAMGAAETLRGFVQKTKQPFATAKKHLANAAERDREEVAITVWQGYRAYLAAEYREAIAAWRQALQQDSAPRERLQQLIQKAQTQTAPGGPP